MSAHLPLPVLSVGDALVIATHNAGKLREIADILSHEQIDALSGGEMGLPEPEETGATFEANAVLKAESGAAHAKGYMVMADDSGLEVDALDGAPGIYSARWAGEKKDFSYAMQRIYDELALQGLEPQGQAARFVCVLSLAKTGYETRSFYGTVEGTLSFPARGDKGFGYDPIFIPNGYSLSFAEMEPDAKHAISHRADAFAKLRHFLYEARQA